jgi:ABC-type enterochelin transport system substrate-binding protein
MTNDEINELKKKIAVGAARRKAQFAGLAEAINQLPPDFPIVFGPRNQQEYDELLKELDELDTEDDDTTEEPLTP